MHSSALHGSAADRVYTYVRDAILARRFTDTELLAEGRIAEETGVSRTPVREALLRLESEGMVRLLPKRGALVVPVGAKEWCDLVATRRLIESHCAAVVVASGRGPLVRELLADPIERQRVSAQAGDSPGYVSADRDFHNTIVAAADNQILSRVYASLRDRQLLMGSVNLLDPSGATDRGRMAEFLAEHEQIAHALTDPDPAVVQRLISDHLDHAAARLTGDVRFDAVLPERTPA